MPPTTRKKQSASHTVTPRKKRRRRKARKGHVEMASASANSTTTRRKRKGGRSGNCPICHKPVKGPLGLAIHNAKKSAQAEHQRILADKEPNGGAARNTSTRNTPNVRVARLREKWMYRANEASPEVREAILDCVIDLATEFR